MLRAWASNFVHSQFCAHEAISNVTPLCTLNPFEGVRVMKIIIIGATGTIEIEVAKALSASKHEVIGASRNGEVKVSLEDAGSIPSRVRKSATSMR